jgi:hypothetical protein
MIGLFGEAANAKTVSADPSAKSTAVPFKVHRKSGLAGAKFTTIDAARRVDPPLGGCDTSDVSGEGTAWYDGDTHVLTSLEATWIADTICYTTAPGQVMAGIIADSSWWHNGSLVANGTSNSCSACNSEYSDGSWVGGPNSSGTYWASALFIYKLPAGWIWSSIPASCIPFPNAADTIECSGTSGTLYIPLTYTP